MGLALLGWLACPANAVALPEEDPEQLFADESNQFESEMEPMDESRQVLTSDMRQARHNDDLDAADEDEQLSSPEADKRVSANPEELEQLDTNIENAKVRVSPSDMATAAGHHHHHHHYVHGKLDMGAHTAKKGAFGWHAKYPVGGKGKK